MQDTHRLAGSELGLLGLGLIMLRAFSLGGGTFTGIEAVSNGVGILREPRVENGKRTMLYMAISLAFTAGGILLCYLLNEVAFESGKTLNASLWELLTAGLAHRRPWTIGQAVVWFTLVSEGALLFVAAQTGFVDGPRTLSAMAVDEWVPKRFKNLSERLVTQNGVLTMGIAAAVVLLYTRGDVGLLVVMYSINVFLTFTLSQIGMARHWIGRCGGRSAIGGGGSSSTRVGATVTATILVIMSLLKFREGGWVTVCRDRAPRAAVLPRSPALPARAQPLVDARRDAAQPAAARAASGPPELSPDGPTAIVLVEAYTGLGIHTALSIQRLFPRHFKNFVFVSVGLVDSAQFKGAGELGRWKTR